MANPLQELQTMDLDAPVEAPPLFMQDVSLAIHGREVVTEFDCFLDEGKVLGILGPSGAGKTAILHILLGLRKPKTGAVEVFGSKPGRWTRKQIRVGYLPESPPGGNGRYPASVMDIVLTGAYAASPRWAPVHKDYKLYAQFLLAQFKLEQDKDAPIHSLAAGKRQCAYLARALVAKPNLLLLDDPVKGLDPKDRSHFLQVFHDIRKQTALSAVLTTTDPRFAVRACDSIVCLNHSITWQGKAEALNKETVTSLFGCDIDFRKQPNRQGPKRKPRAKQKHPKQHQPKQAKQPKTTSLPDL